MKSQQKDETAMPPQRLLPGSGPRRLACCTLLWLAASGAAPLFGQAALPSAEVVPVVDGVVLADGEEIGQPAPYSETTLPDGTRVVSYEWVMLVDSEQRQILTSQAPDLMQYLRTSRRFSLMAGEVLTFSIPPDLDEGEAVRQLVPESLRDRFDRNHVYAPNSRKEEPSARATGMHGSSLVLPQPFAAVCDLPLTVGMIDSWIDTRHPAFARFADPARQLVNRDFVDANLPLAKAHGTAVAALFVGQHEAAGRPLLTPLLPGARILNAAVFHTVPGREEGAPVTRVLAGLDWLAQQEGVRAINMSLAGPPNRVLAQAVSALAQRELLIVAAVGNDGPFGPERYPAAYEDAVGVAATRSNGEVYRWSNQGEHVDFAALGVGIFSAGAEHDFVEQSGTSLAAPVVTAFLACRMGEGMSASAALAALGEEALDLGEPGRDKVYGRGLLHP